MSNATIFIGDYASATSETVTFSTIHLADFHDLRDPAIVDMGDRRRNDDHEVRRPAVLKNPPSDN